MLPELNIERVFRRELDALPVPAEQLWVPNRTTRSSAIVAMAVAGAAIVLALAAGTLIREASGAATQPRGAVTAPSSLPAPSTCSAPAFGANGRCMTLVPNAVQNPAFGYNLTIPGDWREVQMPQGTEPFVRDRVNASPSLTGRFLLDRRVFTARSAQEWSAAGVLAPAWDFDVQVWDRQGLTAIEWARAFPCDDPSITLGTTNCVQESETIRGVTAVVTTVYSFRWHVTSYYLERGDRMLILRYLYSETNQPPGVTEETLREIVRSIGLV
jgi:hypothetical protein